MFANRGPYCRLHSRMCARKYLSILCAITILLLPTNFNNFLFTYSKEKYPSFYVTALYSSLTAPPLTSNKPRILRLLAAMSSNRDSNIDTTNLVRTKGGKAIASVHTTVRTLRFTFKGVLKGCNFFEEYVTIIESLTNDVDRATTTAHFIDVGEGFYNIMAEAIHAIIEKIEVTFDDQKKYKALSESKKSDYPNFIVIVKNSKNIKAERERLIRSLEESQNLGLEDFLYFLQVIQTLTRIKDVYSFINREGGSNPAAGIALLTKNIIQRQRIASTTTGISSEPLEPANKDFAKKGRAFANKGEVNKIDLNSAEVKEILREYLKVISSIGFIVPIGGNNSDKSSSLSQLAPRG